PMYRIFRYSQTTDGVSPANQSYMGDIMFKVGPSSYFRVGVSPIADGLRKPDVRQATRGHLQPGTRLHFLSAVSSIGHLCAIVFTTAGLSLSRESSCKSRWARSTPGASSERRWSKGSAGRFPKSPSPLRLRSSL